MDEMDQWLETLVMQLLHDSYASVSHDNPLFQHQRGLGLFNNLNARLQEILYDEDFSLSLAQEEGGVLFTLKVGDAVNAPPDFSPPEPRTL